MINKKRGENIILDKILNLIYPQVCGICGQLCSTSLCNKCKIKLKQEFNFQIENYEQDISKYFIEHCYFFKYQNIIRNQILGLKFKEKTYIYKTITYFLKKMEKKFEYLKKYDIIIIVPISKQRKKERGYNQSELIGKEISKIIKIPIKKDILYKKINTEQQSHLNKKQREENVKDVYDVMSVTEIYDKKILLIDDIYTTGNTVNECARTLVNKGIHIKNIGVLTIAKD